MPTAGGTILPKVAKAFKELKEVGLIKDANFKIHSAQAAGSAPVIHALHKRTDLIEPVKPNTIAKSIAIGNPADGFYVLKAVRESGGWGDVASDPEIIDAIKLLARTEGIFAEPAGGTTLAVTKKLIEQGRIKKDETVVVSITGNGYKTLEAVANRDRATGHHRGEAQGIRFALRTAGERQTSNRGRGLRSPPACAS